MRDLRNVLSFEIKPNEDGAPSIMPCVDGVPLAALVTAYEEQNGFQPFGGYGGLIPEYFRYGPLDKYFLGQTSASGFWAEIEGVYLLGCRCGEVGCWPLRGKIELAGSDVIWRDFQQPHRPQRDYSRFGPFVFVWTDYERVLRQLPGTTSNQ
jgi:hypothetical protein